MSRIGKRPIKIEEGVEINITPKKFVATCNGKKLEVDILEGITVKEDNGNIIVERLDDSKQSRSYHGLTSRLIGSAITGVKSGFTRVLEYTGTGYRAAIDSNQVVLNMGYSHEIRMDIPEGLSVEIKKSAISITGADKQVIGQFAAHIREVRPPEVYKGKGIKYKEEIIKRKAGKKASS